MTSWTRCATVVALLLLPASAIAQTTPPPAATTTTPDKAPAKPACCNPAANGHAVTQPPGLHVGMPLQPGDLGYTDKPEPDNNVVPHKK